MKRLCGPLCWIVLLTVIVPLGYRATEWLLRYDGRPKADAQASQAGRDLFLHEWTHNDPLAARGDGLGPVFNASSCVACHQQGGAGGSGSLEHNVTVFTRAAKAGAAAARGVIHQFAIDAASQETLQNVSALFPKKSRPTLADLSALLPKPANPAAGVQTIRDDAVPEIDMGQRNTPALFGASIIDAIPDEAILANERNQRGVLRLSGLNGEVVPAGRAAKLSHKRVGKFGWKANIGNLSEFVRVACANELGLGNPLQAQPASLSQPDYRPRGLDLTDQQCDQMTAFIASLPRPREVIPASAPRPPAPSRAKSTSSRSAAPTATLPIWPRLRGSTAICCCTRWGRGSAAAILWRRAAGLVRAAGLRRWLDVPKRVANAAAVGCCRFRSLSSRRPSSDAGRGHQAARRPGGPVCESLHGSLRRPARRADCVPEHVAIWRTQNAVGFCRFATGRPPYRLRWGAVIRDRLCDVPCGTTCNERGDR